MKLVAATIAPLERNCLLLTSADTAHDCLIPLSSEDRSAEVCAKSSGFLLPPEPHVTFSGTKKEAFDGFSLENTRIRRSFSLESFSTSGLHAGL